MIEKSDIQPEVSVDLPQYIGFWQRAIAAVIDAALIYLLVLLLARWLHKEVGDFDGGAVLHWLSAGVTILGWVVLGASPGKWLVGAKVVNVKTGAKIGFLRAVLRYVAYSVSVLPMGLGIVWVAFDKRHQGWHDKIAGTVVVAKNGKSAWAGAPLFAAVLSIFLVLPVAGFVFLAIGGTAQFTSHQVATHALQHNPVLEKHLGSDFTWKAGPMVWGVHTASYTFDAQGTKGNGTITIELDNIQGNWHITRAQMLMAGGEVVCLDFQGVSIEGVRSEGSDACSDLTSTEHVESQTAYPQARSIDL